MKTLNQLKGIAKQSGYALKFTGDYSGNGTDKLYALYVGMTRQSPALTVQELNTTPLFR